MHSVLCSEYKDYARVLMFRIILHFAYMHKEKKHILGLQKWLLG